MAPIRTSQALASARAHPRWRTTLRTWSTWTARGRRSTSRHLSCPRCVRLCVRPWRG